MLFKLTMQAVNPSRYDVIELRNAGFDAVGIDLSQTAVRAAREFVQSLPASQPKDHISFLSGDLFAPSNDVKEVLDRKFDLIYDYTFLCALDPSMRKQWASTMQKMVKPDGELVTLIFPLGDYEGGPPYAMSVELVQGLLEDVGFEAFYLEPVKPSFSHPDRRGKEVLGRWRLK